jgi:para-nitrobenzyl esterase
MFTWQSPYEGGRLGSCHALDLPFIFGTHRKPGLALFAGTGPAADRLSATIQEAWTAFAATGTPASSALPAWPRYDAERRATMLLGETFAVQDALRERERVFWADAASAGRTSA